jgi:hypothetical protein
VTTATQTSATLLPQNRDERSVYNARYAQIAAISRGESDLIIAHTAASMTLRDYREECVRNAARHEGHSALTNANGDCCCPDNSELAAAYSFQSDMGVE